MKASEIRDLPREEIDREIKKIRAQLFKFRFYSDKEENQRGGEIRALRRTIARLKTVLRERELQEAKA